MNINRKKTIYGNKIIKLILIILKYNLNLYSIVGLIWLSEASSNKLPIDIREVNNKCSIIHRHFRKKE